MVLKDFREFHLKMNQQQFAEYLGLSLEKIKEYEEKPDVIPFGIFKKLADKTGMTLDEITGYTPPKVEPIKPDPTWDLADLTRKTLIDYIKRFSENWQKVWGELYYKHIDELETGVQNAIKKPKIAFVGRSDVGKSTLINCILGDDKMPVSWNPTTSIAVYIKHVNDRPAFITDDVWIFKRDETDAWDENRLDDEEYCNQRKIACGGIDILKSYGTHQGDQFNEDKVGAAVIFSDSEVLKNCDIMDLPGFGTGKKGETDSDTLKVSAGADILLYMMLANGFMRDEDFAYLQNALEQLKPLESVDNSEIGYLSNLFIVASHASAVNGGNPDQLKRILARGCSDFYKSFSDDFWKEREKASGVKYTEESLRKRFFTFDPKIPDLCRDLEKNLKSAAELLPKLIDEKAKLFVKGFAESKSINLDEEIKSYNKMVSEKEKYEAMLEEIDKAEPERVNTAQNARMEVKGKIGDLCRTSISDFADQYSRIISVDHIVDTIDKKDLKNKKEDRNILLAHIASALKTELESVVEKKSEELKKIIDDYISEFQASAMNAKIGSLGINFTFNAKTAFASGLAGLATFGGLAFWASTLGNLGAYILVAKGVSILAALGISTGGTAAVISGIAAIGGPITLAIALSVLATATIFSIFSGVWKKSLAKQIVKAYDKENALEKYKQILNKFWDDTQIAFDAAADNMEKEWQEKVANLRGLINNYDVDDLLRRIKAAGEMKGFFTDIPL